MSIDIQVLSFETVEKIILLGVFKINLINSLGPSRIVEVERVFFFFYFNPDKRRSDYNYSYVHLFINIYRDLIASEFPFQSPHQTSAIITNRRIETADRPTKFADSRRVPLTGSNKQANN